MLKKILLSGAAALSLAGTASAADLPRRAAPPLLAPVPVFTWTGFYAGFNAGYGFDVGSNRSNGFVQNGGNPLVLTPAGNFAVAPVLTPGSALIYGRNSNEGFSGGGQIGYNYQFTPGSGIVVGIEADAQYLDFGDSRRRFTLVGTPGPAFGAFLPTNGLLSTLDFFGTVRGRLGYAFDRVMVYGTGGFAYATGDEGARVAFQNFRGRRDDFVTGYAVGGGIEYAIPTGSALSFLNVFNSSAVTLKVEGLYVNLDRNRTGLPLVGGLAAAGGGLLPVFNNARVRNENEFAVVRAGVNYKFGTF